MRGEEVHACELAACRDQVGAALHALHQSPAPGRARRARSRGPRRGSGRSTAATASAHSPDLIRGRDPTARRSALTPRSCAQSRDPIDQPAAVASQQRGEVEAEPVDARGRRSGRAPSSTSRADLGIRRVRCRCRTRCRRCTCRRRGAGTHWPRRARAACSVGIVASPSPVWLKTTSSHTSMPCCVRRVDERRQLARRIVACGDTAGAPHPTPAACSPSSCRRVERMHRHQLDHVDAEVGEVRQPLDAARRTSGRSRGRAARRRSDRR